MFDLFRSRAKAVRYLLGALLLMVALSMVITLIPGYGSGGGAADNIVAEIGGEALTIRDVQLTIQSQMKNQAFPREMAEHYVPLIVDQMITERAIAYQAARMGFQVTEGDVALAIQSMLPALFQDGQFVGQDAYAQYLSRLNTTIPEFESNVRKQMLLLKLQNMVLEGVVVLPREVEEEFRRRNEKVKLQFVSISPAELRSQASPSREEMLDYFNKNRTAYQVAPKRSFDLVAADESRLAERTAVPEAELRRIYNSSIERYRTPERVKVRHILLKTTEKPKEEIPKIKAKAEDLLKQIRGGADFAELARKFSEDPGSATKGGDLDWVARGQTVKNFEDTAFSLKPNEISNVISTEYGFHIIQVQEKEAAKLKPFEEVKGEIASERNKQYLYDRMQNLADQARAELVQNPGQAQQIAGKLGLVHVRVEKVGQGDPIPEVGVIQEFESAIASLEKGGVTPVMQVPPNKLVVAAVTEVLPARPAEFSEVEGQVREQLVSQKAGQLAQQRAQEMTVKLKEAGSDLNKLAQSMGLKIKTTEELGREGTIDGLGPASYVQQAFGQPVGAVVGPMNAGGITVVVKVADRIPADMSKLAAERETIVTALKSKKARERKELFEDGLRAQLIGEGKVKVYDSTLKRLIANYRG